LKFLTIFFARFPADMQLPQTANLPLPIGQVLRVPGLHPEEDAQAAEP
jgi:hypothetical protein